ncbi:MAG: SPOR domain-containing protein [bacterium]|nr:SPOR domain-containing protein [bacterium]
MEKAIKQRLLGGLVLVAGAALFLPMLLDGSGAPLTVPPMPTPPRVPALEAVAPRLDQKVKAASESVAAAHESQAVAPAAEEDVAADAAAEVAVVKPPAPVATVAAKSAADSQRLAAEKAASEKALKEGAAKEKAAQEKLAREKAEKAKAEQKVAEKVQVVAARTAAPVAAAAAKPAALPDAWVVQVASLASKEKSDALVQSLRKKGYRAVAHQQGKVWKVVVGPELRREVADTIRSRLAADPELKLSGWVQPYNP